MAAAATLDLQLKVPAFTGLETRVEVQSFLQKLKACIAKIPAAAADATPVERRALSARKVDTMVIGFTGAAYTWLEKWQRDNHNLVEDYDALLQAFKDRWLEPAKMTDINEIMDKLKQKPNETIESFWDRCHQAACTVMDYENTPVAHRQHDSFIVGRNRVMVNAFTKGVKAPLREAVAKLSNKPINEIIADAKVIERAYNLEHKKPEGKKTNNGNNGHKTKKVHEVSQTEDEEEAEDDEEDKNNPNKNKGDQEEFMVEAFRQFYRQRGRGQFRGRGRGRNGYFGRGRGYSNGNGFANGTNGYQNGYRNGPNGNGNYNGNGNPSRRSNFTCDMCGQFGHGIRMCPMLPAARASVNKQPAAGHAVAMIHKEHSGNNVPPQADAINFSNWPDFM